MNFPHYARLTGDQWWKRHYARRKRLNLEYRRRLKRRVIDAYGGACACCGISTFEFLALDHVNGRGPGDTLKGDAMYRKAVSEGFPATYRVLCHNCNCARGYYGQCPHERERLKSIG